MREIKGYNTKARKCILDFLKNNNDTTVSVSDIIKHLSNNNITVNFTTVYRCLNKLTKEQKVIKITDTNSKKAVYQLANHNKPCDQHIHTQCVKCGKLIHLECHFMNELKEHLYNSHGFTLKCEGSILYGICNECSK